MSGTVTGVGLFRRATPMDQAAVEQMKAELATMKAALDEQRSSTSAIARQLRPRPEQEHDTAARFDALTAKLAELESRPTAGADTAAAAARFDELAAKLAALDERITSVSTELANQVTELGRDIDALGDRPAGDGPGEAVLGELRDGQVRLATEQARYQIAFREDLARLAEQLRRPSA